MKWELTNDFHGSKTTVRAVLVRQADHDPARILLTNRQVRRANKALCGMAECSCGGLNRNHDCLPTSGDFDKCDYEVAVRI
jgi:hypothetical protein